MGCCRPASATKPEALTSRSTSIAPPNWTGPGWIGGGTGGAGGDGGRPGRVAVLGQQLLQLRDGETGRDSLEPHPVVMRCTTVVSAQSLTGLPARSGRSQNCCPHAVRFPDAGTTRVSSTARLTASTPLADSTSGASRLCCAGALV